MVRIPGDLHFKSDYLLNDSCRACFIYVRTWHEADRRKNRKVCYERAAEVRNCLLGGECGINITAYL